METITQSLLFRSGDPDFMTSLARGLEVLRAFGGGDGECSAAEICRATGLSRAVVRRCLYTLCESGYVSQSKDRFRLEAGVLSLAQPYVSEPKSLPTVAQPFLESVSQQTNESCSLAVIDRDDVVYVARSATRRIMTVSLMVGSRLPAGSTSLGRVLLANRPAEALNSYLQRNQLIAHTDKSITSKREFRAEIGRIREKGFAIVDQELEIGLRSIAVPVKESGRTIAAMNIGVQATRISRSNLTNQLLPTLRATAQQLGEQWTRATAH